MVHLIFKVFLLSLSAVNVLAVSKSAGSCTVEGFIAKCKNLKKMPLDLPKTMKGIFVLSSSLNKLDPYTFRSSSPSVLQHLEIVGANISDVASEAFDGLTQLEVLHLGSNKIRSLPGGMLIGLERLQTIVVDNNFLTSVQPGVFQDATELQTIILDHNRIENIAPGAFAQLPNLQLLALNYNRLEGLRQDMFEGMPELCDLYLQHNNIRKLPRKVFKALPSLRTLALSDNLLESLSSDSLKGMEHLQALTLNKNKLHDLIPGTFKPLKDLEELHINDNLLKVLKAATFEGLARLKYLSLNGNLITKIESNAFQHLNNLVSLMLHRNKLRTVEGLTNIPTLVNLELQNNQIVDVLAGALSGVPLLEDLNLSNNTLLRSISPNAFSANKHLQTLLLTGCKSLIMPTNRPLFRSSSLVYINLDDAEISELPDVVFQGVPKVKRITLNNNKLTTIVRGPFRSLPKGSIVEVIQNPLVCDCALNEMLQWSKEAHIVLSGTCSGKGMKDQSLTEVKIIDC